LLGGQGLLPTAEALALGEQALALLDDAPRRRQMALYVTGLFQLRLRREEALARTLERMGEAPAAAVATVYLRRLRPTLEAAVAQRRGDLAAYQAFFAEVVAESRALGDRFETWRATLGLGQARYLQGDLDGAVAVMDQAVDEIRAAGRWHTQIGLASQAVFIRLARDSSAESLALLHEVLPLLQSRGLVFNALGDALAWLPLRQGRLADALRVQAWADACAAADPAVRSHASQRLRDAFAQQTGDAPPPDAPPLDEAGALRLALAGT
jgi:tetratricopeptide (TPR) repeat protein